MTTVNTHILRSMSSRSRSCSSRNTVRRVQKTGLRALLAEAIRALKPIDQATRLRLWARQTRNKRTAALYRSWSDAIRRHEKETHKA